MSAPPPLPPGLQRSEQIVDAFAHRGDARLPPRPPKPGMSGCAIAAIIAVVAGVIGVFVIGILAAIAVPAYQEYLVRSRTQEAFQVAQTLQPRIDEERARSGTCPGNLEIGYGRSAVFEPSLASAVTAAMRSRSLWPSPSVAESWAMRSASSA